MRYFIILLYTALAVASCQSKKISLSGPLPVYSDQEVVQALEGRNSSWEWLIAKAGIDIDSPDEQVGGTLYLRMKRDSVIWMTVKKYSVEAARVQMTPDSFFIVYRFQNAYEKGRLSSLMSHYNLDLQFEDLQQMLFGNVMLPDTSSILVKQGTQEHIISGRTGELDLNYFLNPYTLLLDRMHIVDRTQREVRITYSDYRDADDYGMIAWERNYLLPFSQKETASLKLEFKDFEINKPRGIKFSIPSHYERL